ncbi:MAG: outer membrane beta-barrel protein [Candidatus Eisenbacteria bacterium]|nr:hypothetical protein [Candidatus Eisenbacteria bacterium]
MRRRDLVGIALILCGIASCGLFSAAAAAAAVEGTVPPLEIGGAFIVGGYFDDSRHDWQAGPGAMLFLEAPLGYDFRGRLAGSMLWNDGSDEPPRSKQASAAAPLGGLADSHRRTAIEADLVYKLESLAIGTFGLPYIGAGFGGYERRDSYAIGVPIEGDAVERGTIDRSGWDLGFQALAGVKFYRTSGLFVGLEGIFRLIDTPDETTEAYDIGFVLGYQTGP